MMSDITGFLMWLKTSYPPTHCLTTHSSLHPLTYSTYPPPHSLNHMHPSTHSLHFLTHCISHLQITYMFVVHCAVSHCLVHNSITIFLMIAQSSDGILMHCDALTVTCITDAMLLCLYRILVSIIVTETCLLTIELLQITMLCQIMNGKYVFVIQKHLYTSLTHCLTTHSFTLPHNHSLASLTYTHPFTYSLTCPLTHSLPLSLT